MPNIFVIVWAFGLGLMAAAPVIGPVNMIAIHRGLVMHWTRTMWVGIGSVAFETCEVALVMWGGSALLNYIDVDSIRHYVELPAAGIILLLGLFILRKAMAPSRRVKAAIRAERMRHWRTGFVGDFITGAVLTFVNPATFFYWIGVGPTWLHKADIAAGSGGMWFGVAAASCGMACWFAFITVMVWLRPQKIGPTFFRLANACCGGILTIMGIVLAVKVLMQ
ncbi:MAG: LysE family transporter [Planctomycetota bacterium]|nr:LysE family transporter [Planctomycetota bacterium]